MAHEILMQLFYLEQDSKATLNHQHCSEFLVFAYRNSLLSFYELLAICRLLHCKRFIKCL